MAEGYQKDYVTYEYLPGWKKLAFGEALDQWAVQYGEAVAVTDSNGSITYRQLNELAKHKAREFMAMGLKRGDRVLMQLPNRISFVITTFAVFKAGAIPIMALPAHREAELDGIVKLAEPVLYIVAEKYLGFAYEPMAMEIQQRYSCLKRIVVDRKQVSDWDTELAAAEAVSETAVFPVVDPYCTAILLLSGGTTGTPKLIPRTHADYLYNSYCAAVRCRLSRHSVYLNLLPAAHNFSLSCPGIFGTLMSGGRVVMSRTASPDEALELIGEEGVTITAFVPAMVNVCMEMLELDDDYDISSLQVLQVGGAMLDDGLAARIIRDWDCKLMQVFGTAEGLITFTGLDDPDEIVGSCQGKPLSEGDEVLIVDSNFVPVQAGEYGHLIARGPYTIDGYYKAPEVNKHCFTKDGFYCTGDRAMLTPEGNLRMGGRITEQINRAGEKIMPSEIEAYLCQCEDIMEAAVVGVPDENLGHRSCAFIRTEEGSGPDLRALHQFLGKLGVARYKMPDQLEIVENWPLTSVGKIDKKALAVMALNAGG